MFKDEATIEVEAGRGGNGVVSFRREMFVPFGGPDGGDGGNGGSVIFVATESLNSLLPISRRYRYAAQDGKAGTWGNKSGRSSEDLVLEVPVGTQVYDKARGNLLRDLTQPGMRLVVAQGGRGGLGNVNFANAVRQTPRFATDGKPGEKRVLGLELKLFAEAGLVGLPNAGKSTFLATVTAATPKIADYPFTTLAPQVGIASLSQTETIVLADLPGLIEGASEGTGLGHRFLKHVERCKSVIHLVDVSEAALTSPADAWRVIEQELERFSSDLANKPRILVASKCESDFAEENARALEAASGTHVFRISAVTHRGLDEVLRAAWKLAHASPATALPT